MIYSDTGWEHTHRPKQWLGALEWNQQFVARYGYELHYVRNPYRTYLEEVELRGMFPSAGQRWCTAHHKRGPIRKWINGRTEPLIIDIQGKRAEESRDRRKMPPWSYNAEASAQHRAKATGKPRHVYSWLPIHHWPTTYMYEYAKEQGYELHPVYNFLGRFSCQMCIFASPKDLAMTRRHNPEAFDLVAALERKTGFTMKSNGTIIELADKWEAGQIKDEEPDDNPRQMCMF